MDRVNRVNRQQHGDRPGGEGAGRTSQSAGQVWRNIGSLRTLLARAERELAREPGAYVAVAVVHGDKREEQVGRWGWAGSREAGAQVAGMGARVAPGDRGLRVRVHREGGALVGSALLRRARRDEAPAPVAVAAPVLVSHAGAERRLAALEAQLATALARLSEQDREIAIMKAYLSRVENPPVAVGNLHHRLDAVEAVCERVQEAESTLSDDAEEEEDDDEGGMDEDDE